MDRIGIHGITHVLIHLVGLYLTAFAQDDIWNRTCTNDNATQLGSTNLEQVLTYLASSNASKTYGFANFSAGEIPDVVNGIARCIADLEPDQCVDCLAEARRRLRAGCPNRKEAIGWYYNCMIRYSNRSIFNAVETYPVASVSSSSDAPSKDLFYGVFEPLLSRIAAEAAAGVGGLGKFATGEEKVTGPGNLTIYGLVQCTPDLSESGCRECLESAFNIIPSCCDGKTGARIYLPSCVIRYETSNFFNKAPVNLPTGGDNRTNIIVIIAPTLAAAAAVAVILVFSVYRWCRIKREQEEIILLYGSEAPTSFEGSSSSRLQSDEDERGEMHFFNLRTIQEATNNFSVENKLGEGGFGPVYKGKLNDGKAVAVKRLSKNSGQGLQEFKTEVRLIVKLQHKNLVRLLGCCTQKGEKLLVYEFMPNNSLDTFLFDKAKCRELDWPMRANIVGGIAKGLRYLHEDSRLRIVHRDMKASNVLLDNDMNAKISDFGTARIFGGNQIEDNTNRIVGTYGYMAPEYAMEGVFSNKSDVYSFGVLLLEIISGRKNSGFNHPGHVQNLLLYARRMWKEGTVEQLIDENIRESCIVSEALRWTNIALLCVQEDPNDRPTMSSVVFMLEGQLTSLPQPSEPPFSAVRFVISDQSSSTGAGLETFASSQFSTSGSNTSVQIELRNAIIL